VILVFERNYVHPMNAIDRLAALILLAPLAAAAWFSIHLALADAQFQQHTPESVSRAIAIEPRNTEYLALRALQLDYDGVDSTALLERAANLSPLSSAPRIRLGLAAEIRGDFDSAERWLLDAAHVDRQFEPRWTLANFYFRRQSPEGVSNENPDSGSHHIKPFWKWMREALDVSYGDRRPAFDLCWRVAGASSDSGDPGKAASTILDRAIPDRRDVLAGYLQYTLDSHTDAAGPVALKLAAFGGPSDRPLLLAACDVLIAANHAASAIRLWSALGYPSPAGVFNGSFTTLPLNHGFDWRSIESPGVTHTAVDQPHPAHRISLDGRQPESCALLTQIVNLEPRAHYILSWEARTSGFSAPTGLDWQIAGQHAMIAPSEASANGAAQFIGPSESSQMVSLTLFYQRPAGQPRAEGSVEVTHASLEKLP
jgi:tetratricopeptide (TPR) repeat protein